MTLWEKIKQLWISLRLEKNPYYYTTLDIQKAINDLHHVMTEHKLSRRHMQDATIYVTVLRDHKRVLNIRSQRPSVQGDKQLLDEINVTINAVNKFIDKVHSANESRD